MIDADERCLPVDAVTVVDRHRADLGDVAGLAASIAAEGLLHPIVVTTTGRLIAGARRLAAVRSLGWSEVPVTVVGDVEDAASLLRMERDENECRKPMTPSERVSLGRALEELERPKARERLSAAGQSSAPGRPAETSVRPNEPFDVREVVAPAVGMSTATYSRAKQIVAAAEQGDEAASQAREEMDRTGKVTPAYEKWKGEPVNRGADAPTSRDPFGLAKDAPPTPPAKRTVKNFRGNAATRAVPKSLATLAGLAHAMSTLAAADLAAVPPEVRAQWASDLTDVLSSLRATRDRMKEHTS